MDTGHDAGGDLSGSLSIIMGNVCWSTLSILMNPLCKMVALIFPVHDNPKTCIYGCNNSNVNLSCSGVIACNTNII